MRQPVATLAVAALLVVAGCSAGGDGTTTEHSGSTAPGVDSAGDPPYETPLNETAVLAGHLAALRDAGSYTVEMNTSLTDGRNPTYHNTAVVWTDLESGAMYAQATTLDSTTQVYTYGNSTGYVRRVSGDEIDYDTTSDSVRTPSAWANSSVEGAVALFEFAYAGVTSVDGERRHVYEATALDTTHSQFDIRSDMRVEAANATMYVRSDGLVTNVSYDYTVESSTGFETGTYTATYSDLGDSDTSPPLWVSTARNATG